MSLIQLVSQLIGILFRLFGFDSMIERIGLGRILRSFLTVRVYIGLASSYSDIGCGVGKGAQQMWFAQGIVNLRAFWDQGLWNQAWLKQLVRLAFEKQGRFNALPLHHKSSALNWPISLSRRGNVARVTANLRAILIPSLSGCQQNHLSQNLSGGQILYGSQEPPSRSRSLCGGTSTGLWQYCRVKQIH